MLQLILTAHTGIHDAGAALFEDYKLLAAVQLERLTRFKCDGRDLPVLAIDEVLSIAGKPRKDVHVAVSGRCDFPTIFYRNTRGVRWMRKKYRKYRERRPRRHMP